MKRAVCFAFLGVLALSGCAGTGIFAPREPGAAAAGEDQLRPRARPAGLQVALPAAPRTAEDFDTTTAAERAEAVVTQPASAGAVSLGTTIASLGNPAEPGFWIKTPLVKTRRPGRVDYAATGKTVEVELIPIDGEAGAGSRLSLAALRLLEAPLAGLPEVTVFALE